MVYLQNLLTHKQLLKELTLLLKKKIDYLKELGINVVEFLPVFEWDDHTGNLNREVGLKKMFGDIILSTFFALTKKYSSSTDINSFDEIKEFKELVSKLHQNGMEVILDVVYNHTAKVG